MNGKIRLGTGATMADLRSLIANLSRHSEIDVFGAIGRSGVENLRSKLEEVTELFAEALVEVETFDPDEHFVDWPQRDADAALEEGHGR